MLTVGTSNNPDSLPMHQYIPALSDEMCAPDSQDVPETLSQERKPSAIFQPCLRKSSSKNGIAKFAFFLTVAGAGSKHGWRNYFDQHALRKWTVQQRKSSTNTRRQHDSTRLTLHTRKNIPNPRSVDRNRERQRCQSYQQNHIVEK